MPDRPLLMIPGPIEISDAVVRAASGPPPSHLAPHVIEAFGSALSAMRQVFRAAATSQPFVVAGGGTLAMEAAAQSVIDPGERALVVNTGYFSSRMAEMLRRRGATVVEIIAPVGDAPETEAVAAVIGEAKAAGTPFKALFATHVDTSTGVRVDAEALALAARNGGLLSVFDGVCATGGERFEMDAWGADVYLTASQKAIGLPAGLCLWVASEGAMAAREALSVAPPLSLDWQAWAPIMRAYEERRPSYFSTPPTTLVLALQTGLGEILSGHSEPGAAMRARFVAHETAARAMRAAWAELGLRPVPVRESLAANTLSALYFPEGVDSSLVGKIAARGVIVAGGLHPEIRTQYFRVGHMGVVTGRPEALLRTIAAVADALAECGKEVNRERALASARAVLEA